jgi:hypothetical protein
MFRRVCSLVYWLGRATTYALGLVVLIGLILGPVSLGLAAVGDPLRLGKGNNAGGRVTSVVASLAGPVLKLTNQGSGPALDLRVQGDAPPLMVNSSTKVTSLNADELDGKDAGNFISEGINTYQQDNNFSITSGNQGDSSASCDADDLLAQGGYLNTTANVRIIASAPESATTYTVNWEMFAGSEASLTVRALCYDLPPFRS